VLGGGGFRVPLVYREIVRQQAPIDTLVLHDVDPVRLRVIRSVLADPAGPDIVTTPDLDEALTGADVVFSAVRVGGTAGRVRDERRALALGLLGQETVGAGGIAYGLRTLPFVLQAARRQAEIAPHAFLINFTNPAGLVTQAVREVLGRQVIGICDSPVGLLNRACRALGVSPNRVETDYVGINHLGWLRSVRSDGADLLPSLLHDPARLAGFEEGRLFPAGRLAAEGALPNEYLYYYDAARTLAARLADEQTRGEVLDASQREFYAVTEQDLADAPARWTAARQEREEGYLAESRPESSERDTEDLSGGGYERVALDVLAAVTGGPPAELIVNAANGSAFPQLPPDLVVETWCRVDTEGATPRPAADLTLAQLGLLASVRAAENAAVEAISTGSRAAAVRAFALHPLVLSWELAEQLTTGLLADEPELAALLH